MWKGPRGLWALESHARVLAFALWMSALFQGRNEAGHPGWGLSTSRRQRLDTSLRWLQAAALADSMVSGQVDGPVL